MKAILNTFSKNKLSQFNGLTFDIVGHKDGQFMLIVDEQLYLISPKEILICEIKTEVANSIIRDTATFCDYWYRILSTYCKVNKIEVHANANFSVPEISNEETSNFGEIEIIEENLIFNH